MSSLPPGSRERRAVRIDAIGQACHELPEDYGDGTMAIFRAVTEPTRVHPLQIWRTPFHTVEHVAAKPRDGSYLAKVGNARSRARHLRRAGAAPPRGDRAAVARPVRGARRRRLAGDRRATGSVTPRRATSPRRSTRRRRRSTSSSTSSTRSRRSSGGERREALERARSDQKELLGTIRPDDLRAVEDYLRTYDLRGKKVCVVMAGNPYTDSGARYIENSLTSNATRATLATRDAADTERRTQ